APCPVAKWAARGGRGGTVGPPRHERPLRIAPADQVLQTLEVHGITQLTAERTTLFVYADNQRNASLPLPGGAFKRNDIIGLQETVLSLEQHCKLLEPPALIAQE